jgi:hypothetical protein
MAPLSVNMVAAPMPRWLVFSGGVVFGLVVLLG